MANPLQQTIEALAKEKGIEPDVVISAIEEAVATASRKYYKTGENLKTRFNLETGQVDLFALKTVVEDVTVRNRAMHLLDSVQFADGISENMTAYFTSINQAVSQIISPE